MSLQKFENYNNIPDDLMPKLPPKGSVEMFRFTETFLDPDTRKVSFRREMNIDGLSKVRLKNGNWITVGIITSVTKEGEPVVPRNILRMTPQKDGGYLRIQIGEGDLTDALYQYLMLAPFVSKNLTDDSGKMILEYVDTKKEAQADIAKRTKRMEAVKLALNLAEDQVAEMAIILGIGKGLDEYSLKNAVYAFAENEPDKFLERAADENAPFKARIAHALQLEVVSLNPETSSIHWNDSSKGLVLKVDDITKPESIQSQYAEFAKTDAGKKVDQVLTNAIKKASKKAV